MNGYNSQQQDYSYRPQCPYRNTCPIRNECPFCPHMLESSEPVQSGNPGNMNMYYGENLGPQFYSDKNMKMEEYTYENPYPMTENLNDTAGYANLFPMTDNAAGYANPLNNGYDAVRTSYNPLGYTNPQENIYNPWNNNRMYGQNGMNPLPIPKCPYR